jgi:hypothetical protein
VCLTVIFAARLTRAQDHGTRMPGFRMHEEDYQLHDEFDVANK